MDIEPGRSERPERDLAKVFDLKGERQIAGYVDRFENLLREADRVKDDVSALKAEAKEAMFTPFEIKAMQEVAKLRKDDKAGVAEEKLAAIKRVSKAAGMDLFRWADQG
ncbi:DUF2312 domain-containing protein [Zavarzinia compransoris]|uniref:GapR family DNA-binding domain-containing protein n=1 Tax=Zavarzinia marina TaxID=2911065 RepID=UPI001F48B5AE|nr:GapR family DNA-binding domain-containing protein [Zavarzinia marina]MCF4166354.1 DUF2312 domain-containing protein [Zavarzinia marina]